MKYYVRVDRVAVRSHEFEVEAGNPEAAEEAARELAGNFDFSRAEEADVDYDVWEASTRSCFR